MGTIEQRFQVRDKKEQKPLNWRWTRLQRCPAELKETLPVSVAHWLKTLQPLMLFAVYQSLLVGMGCPSLHLMPLSGFLLLLKQVILSKVWINLHTQEMVTMIRWHGRFLRPTFSRVQCNPQWGLNGEICSSWPFLFSWISGNLVRVWSAKADWRSTKPTCVGRSTFSLWFFYKWLGWHGCLS